MKYTATLAAAAALVFPAAAQAHVTVHPNDVPAGAFTALNVSVPNEETKANTVKVDVKVPPGFLDISVQQVPGWKVKVLTQKLAKPVKTPDGTVTEQVSELIWTGDGRQGKIPPGSFQSFPISTQIPDTDTGKTLAFKAIQTYDDGKVVRWIGPPSADTPAPTIDVGPKGGVIQDVAGSEAGPGKLPSSSGTSAPATKPAKSTGASKGLGIAALVVGILALLAALGALATARGRRQIGPST